jgi:ABC-type nitrate/sulfonate/bicarbonate transport system permease component
VKWRQLVVGLILTLLLWQGLAWLIGRPILPGPWPVLQVFWAELWGGQLGSHFLVSVWRVLAGIGLATVLAVPAGLALGQSQRLNALFSPLVYIAYPVPKVVLLPIFLLLLGIGDLSKIVLIATILFFQILVVVRDEASTIRPELIMSVRSLGAGRLAIFRFVYLPASVPAMLTALRLSIGTAVAVLFLTESFATTSGLGYYIMVESWGRVAYTEMYAGVLAMSLLGVALYYLTDWLERRFAPWLHVKG